MFCRAPYVLLFMLFVVSSWCVDARGDTGFRPITIQMGLPSSQVSCIMQDSRGYVWFGTSAGLSRFDGYRFRNYFSHSGNEHSLLNDYVKSIREDAQGASGCARRKAIVCSTP